MSRLRTPNVRLGGDDADDAHLRERERFAGGQRVAPGLVGADAGHGFEAVEARPLGRDRAPPRRWLAGGPPAHASLRMLRSEAAVVAVSILAWLVATAWIRPLLLPDEGRYVGVAWEMMRSGDWLTPTLNGLPFFHKPPLFYWITAASMSLFGANEFAARAAPLLGACIGAFALYLFLRRWCGTRTARFSVVALLAQPLFYIGGQFANLDMLVGGCITATILLLAHAALCVDNGLPHRRTLLGAYAFAALGVLAKGLIGVVVPALVIGVWLILLRRWRPLRSLLSLTGIAVFMAIAAPWFIAMQSRFDGYAYYFFVVQHFKRFATGGFNNVQPFWFFPALLLVCNLFWLPWLLRSIQRIRQRAPDPGSVRLLMGLWVVVVTLFFSTPASKLIGYILPALAPLAFLVADGYLVGGASANRAPRLWWTSACVATILSLGVVLSFAARERHSTREIAAALGAQRAPDEPVFMLNQYAYDVPFYARLTEPVGVVDDWTSPEIRTSDGWRKELADAATFLPARTASPLISPAALAASVCRAPVSWIMGSAAAGAAYPFLSAAQVVATVRDMTLWRVEATQVSAASSPQCAMPAPAERPPSR